MNILFSIQMVTIMTSENVFKGNFLLNFEFSIEISLTKNLNKHSIID